ncbi:MAG: pseudaminic acid cytidylyltransferase [Leptonema sp. (in: Bacteria)]|nr:pseudaminic acid cytidylyltransferase [Leptonema sp. (in: bacteria)]
MNIAVIPARGGSKRIPRKNIKEFCGKPMIAYAIEAAQKSQCFEHIIVSTDDDEIADVAKTYGAEVPFMRPKELADDYTGTAAVTLDSVKRAQSIYGPIEYVCTIYATAPFVQNKDLTNSLKELHATGKLAAFTLTTFPYPIQRALRLTANQGVEMIQPEHRMTRSQDLEETYHDAGQFYWDKASILLREKNIQPDDILPIILPRYQVQDIDTMEDWIRAERLYKVMY